MSFCLVDKNLLSHLRPFISIARAGVLQERIKLPSANHACNKFSNVEWQVVDNINLDEVDEKQHSAYLANRPEDVAQLVRPDFPGSTSRIFSFNSAGETRGAVAIEEHEPDADNEIWDGRL